MIDFRLPRPPFRLGIYSIAFALFLSFSPLAPAWETDSAEERRQFQMAEKALREKRLVDYRNLKGSLRGYPLLPYLEFGELTADLAQADPERIKAFLTEQDDSILAARLRASWLKHLGAGERWAEFLEFYRTSESNELRCYQLKALIATGKTKEAYDHAKAVWLQGETLPATCDPVFESWHKAGKLTSQLVWERLDLIRGGKDDQRDELMRQMRRFLPPKEYPWHDLWMQTLGNPQKVVNSPLLDQSHPSRDLLLVHSLNRIGWKDRDGALAIWNRYKDVLAPAPKKRIEKGLGTALAYRRHPGALTFLGKVKSCSQMPGLCELRIRQALRQFEWGLVSSWIDELPKADLMDEEWRYWKARALEQKGQKAEAAKRYAELAKDRSYYGFLAADRAGLPYRLESIELAVPGDELRKVANMPALQRAHEFFLLGRPAQARSEWNWGTQNLDHNGLKAAAKLAKEWNWSNRAIMTLLPTGYWDDLDIRFPLEYRETVEAEAKEVGISSAWVFAILRQESSFAPDARSPVGALGLMQMMPKTAHHVGKKRGMTLPFKESDILTPKNNIRLGSGYLKELFEDFNGELLLATPSYNAGPHRTRAWLPEKALPADLWVEFIPYDETRLYVKRVLSYVAIYESRLGMKVVRLKDRMPEVNKALLGSERRTVEGSIDPKEIQAAASEAGPEDSGGKPSGADLLDL